MYYLDMTVVKRGWAMAYGRKKLTKKILGRRRRRITFFIR
jgi:hypothetical protein